MKEAKKMRISNSKVLFFYYLYRLSQIEHDIPDPLTMEKIFVMLRVTEDKGRNFEKRGYIGKESIGNYGDITVLYRMSEYGE